MGQMKNLWIEKMNEQAENKMKNYKIRKMIDSTTYVEIADDGEYSYIATYAIDKNNIEYEIYRILLSIEPKIRYKAIERIDEKHFVLISDHEILNFVVDEEYVITIGELVLYG